MAGNRNSGRKSNAEIARFRELIDRAVTDGDWLEIIEAAKVEAKGTGKGANLARVWLAANRFGLPTALIDVNEGVEPIKFFEIVRAYPRESKDGEVVRDERTISDGGGAPALLPAPRSTKDS